MQTGSNANRNSSSNQTLSRIAMYTLLCFALAGLIAGFAIGGFAEHNQGHSAANTKTSQINVPSVTPGTNSPTITPTPEDIQPGDPIIGAGDYSPSETADGSTSYTLSAQIVNKGTSTLIQTHDVTCRLWLTKDAKATQTALSANGYALPKAVNTFGQAFPSETQGALNFSGGSQQVQSCAANAKTTWTYTLAQTLDHGTYYLAVLADWQGKHYNWYLAQIKVNSTQDNGGNTTN